MSAPSPSASRSTSTGAATSLSDVEYHRLAGQMLDDIEAQVDAWLDADVIDIDSHRTGGLLELHFPGGSKIIINQQPPLHEIWLAAKGGGFHYRYSQGRWLDTRDGSELLQVLSQQATAQAGLLLQFKAR